MASESEWGFRWGIEMTASADEFVPFVDALAGEPASLSSVALQTASTAINAATAFVTQTLGFGVELGRIVAGDSEVAPETDRRFADETWSTSPFHRRVAQGYLAWTDSVKGMVDDLGLEGNDRKRADFVAEIVTSSAAPTNTLAGNPAALKRALETGGKSLLDGLSNFIDDQRDNNGMPSMVDTEPFVVGETIAVTPGQVVFRNDVLELIQYTPQTDEVHERPLLIVPPQINKYYVLDLAPGRSYAEFAVSKGHQTCMISWRNPGPDHAEWTIDTYVDAIDQAMNAALEITGQENLNLVGTCAGGITTAALLGNMAAEGDHRVNAVTFLVTVLDWSQPSTLGSFLSGSGVALSRQQSQHTGIVTGADLARTFAWMRPTDLVWGNWVNNYLMGNKPAAFDILAWNADNTNLPAGLHSDFLEVAGNNAMATPNKFTVRGAKVDLSSVITDTYVVAGLTDHITPWESAYQTLGLLGGPARFVLTGTGHIQTLVCPEDNPKARYFTNEDRPEDAQEWKDGSDEQVGSWWSDWNNWLTPRAGALIPAPRAAGSHLHAPIDPAPGSYVHENASLADRTTNSADGMT